MVTLEGLQGGLLEGLELVLAHLVNLVGEDDGGVQSGVNAVSLDGDDVVTHVLEEHLGVQRHDSALIGLGDIHEDGVNHGHQHAVLGGVTGILDDGDNVGTALGHIGQVTTGAVGELNREDGTLGADKVGHVADGGTGGTSQVQDLGAGLDVDGAHTVVQGSGQLGTVGVPDTVLLLVGLTLTAALDPLLAVGGDTGDHVQGAQSVSLTLADEDTGVAHMGLDDDLGTSGTTAATTTSTATTVNTATTT
eukprot:446861_1